MTMIATDEYINKAVLFDLVTRSLGHDLVVKSLTGFPIVFHGGQKNRPGDHYHGKKGNLQQGNHTHGIHSKQFYRVHFRTATNQSDPLSGHFFAVNEMTGHTIDPYNADWQVPGSNGMCQTFSIMTCLGETHELRPGQYLHNAKIALMFAANNTPLFVLVWRKYARDSCYEEPHLNATELREDIMALIASPDFADIFSREETFFYSTTEQHQDNN